MKSSDFSIYAAAMALATRAATQCTNTATSRDCWGDYDIDTNWYTTTPSTGVTREYWLSVTNTSLAPDGYERQVLTFNNTIPGPTLTADWGDNIIVHVTNNLEHNGTAIHWHGIRQLENSEYDGVPGVTQCPIAPGDTLTYEFPATQYGTTWYHSHYTLQYADGLLGPLIINGPATADYDVDLGVMMLQDWGHSSAFRYWDAVAQGPPPTLENILINGTNTYDCSTSTDAACLGTGEYAVTNVVQGTKYRLRLINTAVDGHFQFSIDNHTFTVISNDLVPIVPYNATSLLISIGQRYDIIIDATSAVDDYWIRAGWQSDCSQNLASDNGQSILRYDSTSTALPTSTGPTFNQSCGDESLTDLVPWVAVPVGSAVVTDIMPLSAHFDTLFTWTINSSSLFLNWSSPTNLKVYNNESIFPTDYNVISLPQVDEWVYIVIQDETGIGLYHPIHLHGHDMSVIAQDVGTFDINSTPVNLVNPPRRDVMSLPAGGFLAMAFKTDNPGSWLTHCHIAWHASQGLALQFVEREDEIASTMQSADAFTNTCDIWNEYTPTEAYLQDDSGI